MNHVLISLEAKIQEIEESKELIQVNIPLAPFKGGISMAEK